MRKMVDYFFYQKRGVLGPLFRGYYLKEGSRTYLVLNVYFSPVVFSIKGGLNKSLMC